MQGLAFEIGADDLTASAFAGIERSVDGLMGAFAGLKSRMTLDADAKRMESGFRAMGAAGRDALAGIAAERKLLDGMFDPVARKAEETFAAMRRDAGSALDGLQAPDLSSVDAATKRITAGFRAMGQAGREALAGISADRRLIDGMFDPVERAARETFAGMRRDSDATKSALLADAGAMASGWRAMGAAGRDALAGIAANQKLIAGMSAAGAAGGQIAAGMRAGAQATGLMAHETANLSAQLMDLGVQAAQGQFATAIIQQGAQITQVFGAGGSVMGALKSLGGVAMTMITSPLNWVVLGFAAAAFAAQKFFGSTEDELKKVDKDLQAHADLISSLRDRYGEAMDGLEQYASESDRVFGARLRSDLQTLKDDIGTLGQALLDELTTMVANTDALGGIVNFDQVAKPQFERFQAAIDDFMASVRLGQPDVTGFREEVSRLSDLEPENAALQRTAATLLGLSAKLAEVTARRRRRRKRSAGSGSRRTSVRPGSTAPSGSSKGRRPASGWPMPSGSTTPTRRSTN